MARGALGAADVRRVGYGLEVGHSGRGGDIVSPRAQLVDYYCYYYCLRLLYIWRFFLEITPG